MKLEPGIIEHRDCKSLLDIISRNYERLITYFPQTVWAFADEEKTKTHVTNKIQDAANKVCMFHVIIDTQTGKIIGCMNVKEIDWNVPKAELFYFIDKDVEGKGIVTKYQKEVVEIL